MSLENKTITDLASLSSTTISDNDLVLFVDLKSNETKNIRSDEFSQYNITSSGILVSLISGSFTGSFTGSLNGLIVSSSYASSASLSLTSSNLFYNGLYNGTASYSMNSAVSDYSLTSSYSLSSSYASSSSYATTSSYSNLILTGSTNSTLNIGIADYSLNSLESYTSSYIKYDGQDNGTVFRSITSERSNYCFTASNLLDDNTTITLASFTSSFAQSSITSSYIVSASWSNFSETSSLGSDIVFSYVRFRLQTSGTAGKYDIIPESWYNVINIGMSPNPINFEDTYDILFNIKFKDYAMPSIGNEKACISNFKPTVVSNFQFGNESELKKSRQSGGNGGGGKAPYYFNYNGYSCTNAGFVLKFQLVLLDFDSQIWPRTVKQFGTFGINLANDLLEGSIFTAAVYIDPRGIDINTPHYTISPFVNHTSPC